MAQEQGFYVNVEVNRTEAARYGLTVADVQQVVTSGIGGKTIAENIEGRQRYPINVRYSRDFRDNVQALTRLLIATPGETARDNPQCLARLHNRSNAVCPATRGT